MKFDFYLSEMSVSDKHGGGLTLRRVLGDDLNDIPHFIHVNRFAADLPANTNFLARSTDFLSVWESDSVRKLIGRSLAAKIGKKLLMIKTHASGAAKKIDKIFKDKPHITGLICPQGANTLFTLEALKKIKRVSYVTWMMDDHLLTHNGNAWQYPPGMEQVFATHLREAVHVFVISSAMQQFYKERFNIESTVLFGSSDSTNRDTFKRAETTGALRIGYFGAVAAWQIDALKAVADALAGTDIQLDIYSGINKLPIELNNDNVHFKGSVTPQQVMAQMRNYNAVLLPISFHQKMRNMSEFNIATKMSEYLASGVAILAVGPPYAAMITYLEANNAAITVSSDIDIEIRAAFKQLRNAKVITGIVQNAQKLVDRDVGSEPMRAVWQATLNNLPEFN